MPKVRPTDWTFFGLVIALSLPFWIVGAVINTFLPPSLPINLPTAALMAFNPAIAALILSYRHGGRPAVMALLRRIGDFQRVPRKAWYGPIFLLMPAVMVINYAWVVWRGQQPQPVVFSWLTLPVLFIMFWVGGYGEELGWQGYAFDGLAPRYSALAIALGMGLFWALFHAVPLIEAQRTTQWILWHCSGQVCLRVLIVWIYNNTGKSVFAVSLFHAMLNVSEYMIPNYGSSYDPVISTSVLIVLTLMVILIWRPETLAQRRSFGAVHFGGQHG